ncbi:MAG: glycosyltransferase family 2 protein [Methanobacteriaceae archaeon]
MLNYPVLSIIIPVYNVEDYLEECLDSILNQTLEDIEVICINDGSTDSSLNILNKYSKIDSRVKVFTKVHQGQSIARNIGVDKANGKYIAFVDSDDYIDLNAYEELCKFAEENKNDMVIFNSVRIKNSKIKSSKLHEKAIPNKIIKTTNVFEHPKFIYDTSPCNKIIRRSFWDKKKFKFVENRYYEDVLLLTELHCASKSVGVRPDILYYWRVREGANKSTTQKTHELKNLNDRIFVINKIKEIYNSSDKYSILIPYNNEKIISHDLLLFINKLFIADKDYVSSFKDLILPILNEIPEESYSNLEIIDQLKYEILIDGNMKTIIKLINYQKEVEELMKEKINEKKKQIAYLQTTKGWFKYKIKNIISRMLK